MDKPIDLTTEAPATTAHIRLATSEVLSQGATHAAELRRCRHAVQNLRQELDDLQALFTATAKGLNVQIAALHAAVRYTQTTANPAERTNRCVTSRSS